MGILRFLFLYQPPHLALPPKVAKPEMMHRNFGIKFVNYSIINMGTTTLCINKFKEIVSLTPKNEVARVTTNHEISESSPKLPKIRLNSLNQYKFVIF